jgi:glycosyltransferase involved in cell wall biosynthesis
MMLRPLDLVWCLSRAQVAPLRHVLGSGTRVEFLKFGVDTRFFDSRPMPAQPAVLSIGNDKDRDTPTLLAALELVQRARPDVALRVQFSGDHRVPAGVERLAAMTHAELREEYARSTVVAIATRPNLHVSGMTAVLEGMATGRPVVLTRTPGAEDYVSDGNWGFLTEPGKAQDLARRILEALQPDNAHRLGAAGREAAVADFDTSHMARRLAAILASYSPAVT